MVHIRQGPPDTLVEMMRYRHATPERTADTLNRSSDPAYHQELRDEYERIVAAYLTTPPTYCGTQGSTISLRHYRENPTHHVQTLRLCADCVQMAES